MAGDVASSSLQMRRIGSLNSWIFEQAEKRLAAAVHIMRDTRAATADQ